MKSLPFRLLYEIADCESAIRDTIRYHKWDNGDPAADHRGVKQELAWARSLLRRVITTSTGDQSYAGEEDEAQAR